MPTATPRAGRLMIEVMSLPTLLGRTALSEGGMDVELLFAVLPIFSS